MHHCLDYRGFENYQICIQMSTTYGSGTGRIFIGVKIGICSEKSGLHLPAV